LSDATCESLKRPETEHYESEAGITIKEWSFGVQNRDRAFVHFLVHREKRKKRRFHKDRAFALVVLAKKYNPMRVNER